jgi:hypothetical protein
VPHPLAVQLGALDSEEVAPRSRRHRARQHRLGASRGTVQQDALGRLRTHARHGLRAAECVGADSVGVGVKV